MISRLELLKRRNLGRSKVDAYTRMFLHFKNAEFIDLESSLGVLENSVFATWSSEIISESSLFYDSDILRGKYLNSDALSKCYIYTYDHIYCGIFISTIKEAIENAFELALVDSGNTCFILDQSKKYCIRIDYYGSDDSYYPNCYEIEIGTDLIDVLTK